MKAIGQLFTSVLMFSVMLLIGGCVFRKAHTVPLLNLAQSPQQSLHGHDLAVHVAFSPNGKMLATVCADKTAKIWDLKTGKTVFTLSGHQDGLLCLGFSPDGKLLATGGLEGPVRLWDTATGQCVRVIETHASLVQAVTFSPDGSLLAIGAGNGVIRIWGVASGREEKSLPDMAPATSLAFSPNGKRLASSFLGVPVKFWDTQTWREVGSITPPVAESTHAIVFSSDGKYLAGGNDDTTARIWDAKTGKDIHVLKRHWGNVNAVAFSPDSKILATGGDFSINFWDTATGQNIGTITPKKRDPKHDLPVGGGTFVYSLAFSPDGSLLAVGSLDGIVDLWAIPQR